MDFNSLKDQVSNLTLYDIKAYARKAQNAVMNYTELEAKVREATNNEPWGASTTLMNEIAQGTFSYQGLGEIMPMLYKRFTEKTAEEWRQIYKALQLLEFLIKNGSERVVDDARSHISLLKMLRAFEFIDQNGKDQGLNVRNRAKELAELLSDVDRIRAERKKARGNRNKYGGVEGGSSFSGGMSSGGRFGGFGSEDMGGGGGGGGGGGYGGYSGGVFGDGGGFGGQEHDSYGGGSSTRRQQYEEYDEGDDAGSAPRRTAPSSSARKPAPPPKPKEPEVDLFEFGDDDVSAPAPAPAPARAQAAPAAAAAPAASSGFDDFDDFVSADAPSAPTAAAPASSISPPPQVSSAVGSSTTFAAPKPTGAPNYNIMSSISPAPSAGIVSPPPQQSTPAYQAMSATNAAQPLQPSSTPSAQAPKPSGYQPATPNYFTSVRVGASGSPAPSGTPGSGVNKAPSSPLVTGGASKIGGAKPAAGGDAFASLWGTASAGAGVKKATPGPNLSSMAKEKANQSIWGAPAAAAKPAAQPQQQQQTKPSAGGGLDDLLG